MNWLLQIQLSGPLLSLLRIGIVFGLPSFKLGSSTFSRKWLGTCCQLEQILVGVFIWMMMKRGCVLFAKVLLRIYPTFFLSVLLLVFNGVVPLASKFKSIL
jgi:hypothetical protein